MPAASAREPRAPEQPAEFGARGDDERIARASARRGVFLLRLASRPGRRTRLREVLAEGLGEEVVAGDDAHDDGDVRREASPATEAEPTHAADREGRAADERRAVDDVPCFRATIDRTPPRRIITDGRAYNFGASE